jgi:hypothetical protein
MLSNMKVFNRQLQTATIETLAQMVNKFNAASRGAIVLTSDGFEGDYRYENFWASIHSAQRRVDRYATNTAASATNLAQLQAIGVKVAGGFGPVLFEPGQMSWVSKSPAEAIEVISRNMAEAIMKDQLNSAIAALVAAIEAGTTNTVYDANTGPITYRDMNSAHALFGDHSGLIIANVMDGTTYHKFIDQNLANRQSAHRNHDAGRLHVRPRTEGLRVGYHQRRQVPHRCGNRNRRKLGQSRHLVAPHCWRHGDWHHHIVLIQERVRAG